MEPVNNYNLSSKNSELLWSRIMLQMGSSCGAEGKILDNSDKAICFKLN